MLNVFSRFLHPLRQRIALLRSAKLIFVLPMFIVSEYDSFRFSLSFSASFWTPDVPLLSTWPLLLFQNLSSGKPHVCRTSSKTHAAKSSRTCPKQLGHHLLKPHHPYQRCRSQHNEHHFLVACILFAHHCLKTPDRHNSRKKQPLASLVNKQIETFLANDLMTQVM